MDTKLAFKVVWDALHDMADHCYELDEDGVFFKGQQREDWERICEAMAFIEENFSG